MNIMAFMTSNEQHTPQDQQEDQQEPVPEERVSADPPSKPPLKPKQDKHSPRLEEMKLQIDQQQDTESKLNLVVQYMESSLSQEGSPDFKVFWESRNFCLELLKESLPAVVRSAFWVKYRDLSKEARRLKDILDQESDYTAEQIEIAIQDLEQELTQTQIPNANLEPLNLSNALLKNRAFYENTQTSLSHFNTIAARINALRKELIKTEMRIRTKNKFFQRLSTIGDHIFPVRKELIKEISQQFSADVDSFVQEHFGNQGHPNESIFALREEIKILQHIAKLFTLNTQAFNSTRLRLSECWDTLKASEKERKKHFAEKKVLSKQNAEQIRTKIQGFLEAFAKGEISVADAHQEVEQFVTEMRKTELDRDDVKALREELTAARRHIQDKVKDQEDAKRRQELERDQQKQEKIVALQQKIKDLINSVESYSVETLLVEKENLLGEISRAPLNKSEKQDLEKLLRPLKEVISDKKEKALLSLPQDKREALLQLKELLQQRKERREQIKLQLKQMKKAGGSSGFDIGRAWEQTQLIDAEKERLEKANHGIKEIEEKISEIENEGGSID